MNESIATLIGPSIFPVAQDEPRKAYIIAASRGYLPGLAATLNALDYHGNHMDVHWIWYDSGKLEIAEAERLMSYISDANLDYNIYAVPMSKLVARWPEGAERSHGWQTRFYKYPYMASLASEYDVVGAGSGDTLVVNYIEPWWDFIAGTKYLLTSNHSGSGLGHLLNVDSRNNVLPTYISDIPLIFCPDRWKDVTSSIWRWVLQQERGAIEIKAVNRAVLQESRVRDVVCVTEGAWVAHALHHLRVVRAIVEGRRMYAINDGLRFWLNTIHGKWWRFGNCRAKIAKATEQRAANFRLINEEYRLLLSSHKLKPNPEDFQGWSEELRAGV